MFCGAPDGRTGGAVVRVNRQAPGRPITVSLPPLGRLTVRLMQVPARSDGAACAQPGALLVVRGPCRWSPLPGGHCHRHGA